MTAAEPIRVALVDDHVAIRDAITGWCRAADPAIRIDAVHENPDTFLTTHPTPAQFDAVILDLQFDSAPNLDAVTALSDKSLRVVIYSGHHMPALVLTCLELGAVTYLAKTEGSNHLVAAIHAAASDRPYMSPTMAKAMTDDNRTHRPGLSPREREVLRCWLQTDSKTLVGQRLYITTGTVNTHLERIRLKYAKAGRPATTKAALVARAIQDGIITADEL